MQQTTRPSSSSESSETEHAVGLRLLAECFESTERKDSAIHYHQRSIETFRRIGREEDSSSAKSLNRLGNLYSDLGDYRKAEESYRRSLKIRGKVFGQSHPYCADVLFNLGILYVDMKDYGKAESCHTEALGIRRKALGDAHPDFVTSLNVLGDVYRDLNDFNRSEAFYRQAIEAAGKALGEGHPDHIRGMHRLIDLYSETGESGKAELLYIRLLGVYEKTIGESDPDYADALNDLGLLYNEMGEYGKAETCHKKALAIRRKSFGENHSDCAASLNNLGNLYSFRGEYAKAEPYYKEAVEVYRNCVGEDHPDYATSLNNLGVLYYEMGDYGAAEPRFIKALGIRRKSLPKDHPDYTASLNNLGNLYSDLGEYRKAEPHYRETLEAYGKSSGGQDAPYAKGLNNLGVLYRDMGAYGRADSCFRQSLEILKKNPGEDHPAYAGCLNNLGLLHSDMADFKKSEAFYQQAIGILKKNPGEDHPEYASSLNNLGLLYSQMGDYAKAEPLYRKSLETFKKALGTQHPDYAKNLLILGRLYADMGESGKAEVYFRQALEIERKSLGEEHPDYASSLENMGSLYKDLGDIGKAEACFEQALRIRKKSLGEMHPAYAGSLNNLGRLYLAKGEWQKAEGYSRQAPLIHGKALGEKHPVTQAMERSLAGLLVMTGREREGYTLLERNFRKSSDRVIGDFEWLSENQQLAYWKKESGLFDQILSLSDRAYESMPEFASLAYDDALFSKSRLLEARISTENYYRDVDELRELLAQSRRQLFKMESEGSVDRQRMDRLRTESDSLDKRLALSWPEYAAQKRNLSVSWLQVRERLGPDEAAIEFVRFRDSASRYRYNALLIRRESTHPLQVSLCLEDSLKGLDPQYDIPAFHALVWEPLEAHLSGVKTVYYAPAGILNNLPFHAFYSKKATNTERSAEKARGENVSESESAAGIGEPRKVDNRYLMDRYRLHQLTSTRYLAMGLKDKARKTVLKSIGLVGGVNYDYLPNYGKSAPAKNTPVKENRSANPGTRGPSKAPRGLAYLQGTEAEVDTVASLALAAGWKAQKLKHDEALEENMLRWEGADAKGVLHIATHGYAFPETDPGDTAKERNSLRYSYRFSPNPMVRSGLVLAGGNWTWTGSDTLARLGAEQNGVLTALEVSQLNLRKTRLVVLSACETGVGRIEGAEGSFGLKRGFKLAGVDQIVLSLWSVPDRETMELMTLFYTDLTVSLDPVASFEKAQAQMRRRYPAQPGKWAAFVLVR
jgi:tetratricopeptide (TPR) repeat protein